MSKAELFDYFYGNENGQFLFLQLPLAFIKDVKFKKMSDSVKIAYSLMLNRTSLSAKNGWLDEHGRVYIIYTIEEIMSDLNCGKEKAVKVMKDLREIGLIKTIRRGLTKPNLIYVMNFATQFKYQTNAFVKPDIIVKSRNPKPQEKPQETKNQTLCISVVETPSVPVIEPPDTLVLEPLEVGKPNAININQRNIEHNYIESNHIQSNDSAEFEVKNKAVVTDKKRSDVSPAQSVKSSSLFYDLPPIKDDYNFHEKIIKENIDYDTILSDNPRCKETLNCIVHVMASTFTTRWKDGYISMGQERVPVEVVKSVFTKINKDEVEYFIDNYNRQTKPIIKITPYVRTSLYRNHSTNDFYWNNRVRTDYPQIAGKSLK